MLDEKEFFSPTASARCRADHQDHPFASTSAASDYRVDYLPAESNTGMFGGNSNWRGPVWMPVNFSDRAWVAQPLLFYGDDFTVECPTGSGNAHEPVRGGAEISRRLAGIFLRDATGTARSTAAPPSSRTIPHWRDYILFYEYFHGDNGAGLGASHQTGWTGIVARLIDLFGRLGPEEALMSPKERQLMRMTQEQVGGASAVGRPEPTPYSAWPVYGRGVFRPAQHPPMH